MELREGVLSQVVSGRLLPAMPLLQTSEAAWTRPRGNSGPAPAVDAPPRLGYTHRGLPLGLPSRFTARHGPSTFRGRTV